MAGAEVASANPLARPCAAFIKTISGRHWRFCGIPAEDRAMTLNDKLSEWWEQTRERAPEVYAAYTLFVRELKRADVSRHSLRRGDLMPIFTLPNTEGRLVHARELLGRGALVLSFFRGGWCPYCRMELEALQEAHPTIVGCGATVAAITPDTGADFIADMRRSRLDFDVL